MYLIITESVFLAEPLDHRADQRRLVQVLALLTLLVDPQFGKHLLDLGRHQAREDGVAGVLGSRRQDAVIKALVEGEILRQ